MELHSSELGHGSAIVMGNDPAIVEELRRRGVERVRMARNAEALDAAILELHDEHPVIVVDAREDRVAAENIAAIAKDAFDHLAVVLWGGRSETMQLVLGHGAERLVWCARGVAPRALVGLALLHAA